MPKIIKVEGMVNKGTYGIVHVVLEDGTEATVWVGGDVEGPFYNKEQVKVFVKRKKDDH